MASPDDMRPVELTAHLTALLAENIKLRERVDVLEHRVEELREAGDDLWYCVRHAARVEPETLIEAVEDWRTARNDG
jgi:cell division septum initiation protein DivIVA